jgi:hypothetical protein
MAKKFENVIFMKLIDEKTQLFLLLRWENINKKQSCYGQQGIWIEL